MISIFKYLISWLTMILLDIYYFNGPLLNGLMIIIFLFFRAIIKKGKWKTNAILLFMLILSEFLIITVGNYYNNKIKIEAEKLYIENMKQKQPKIEAILHGKKILIYENDTESYIFARLYNFQTSTFKNLQWQDLDEN